MQNLVLRMKLHTQWRVKPAISLFILTTSSAFAWSSTPYNGVAGMPWSSGFSPWSMGANPWSSGFSPWGGNGWSSSMMPWGFGNNLGNSWGNNSWMPWSNGSNFFGRRNNNDWVTSMFLMNSLNNQQPWNMGMMPNYNYQAPSWQQIPMQAAPNAFYQVPQPAMPNNLMPNPNQGQILPAIEQTNFPPTSSSFSPFLEANPLSNTPAPMPNSTQTQLNTAKPDSTNKTLVFPDGSRF